MEALQVVHRLKFLHQTVEHSTHAVDQGIIPCHCYPVHTRDTVLSSTSCPPQGLSAYNACPDTGSLFQYHQVLGDIKNLHAGRRSGSTCPMGTLWPQPTLAAWAARKQLFLCFWFFINILSSLSKVLWNAVSVLEFCFVICEIIPTNRIWEILNWICRRVIGCPTLFRRKDWTVWCTGKRLGQTLWGKSMKIKLGLKVSCVVTLPLSSKPQQRHHHPHTLWSSCGSSG